MKSLFIVAFIILVYETFTGNTPVVWSAHPHFKSGTNLSLYPRNPSILHSWFRFSQFLRHHYLRQFPDQLFGQAAVFGPAFLRLPRRIELLKILDDPQ